MDLEDQLDAAVALGDAEDENARLRLVAAAARRSEERWEHDARESLRLANQNARLRKALEEAAIGFDYIVEAETADGNRNSFAAQQARGDARRIRALLDGTVTPHPLPTASKGDE